MKAGKKSNGRKRGLAPMADESTQAMDFEGCELAKVRCERRMTIEELAERTGIAAGLLEAFEDYNPGSHDELATGPSVVQTLRICRALGVRLPELCEPLGRGGAYDALLRKPRTKPAQEFDPRKFRNARLKARLSVEQLAEYACVPEDYVKRLEDDLADGDGGMVPLFAVTRIVRELASDHRVGLSRDTALQHFLTPVGSRTARIAS